MPVKIIVPTPMQRYTMNQDEVEVGGATVGPCLAALVGKLPRHQASTCSMTTARCGPLSMSMSTMKTAGICKAGATPVQDGDTLTIVPSIAGGLDAVGTGGAPSFHLAQNPDLEELSNDEVLRYSRHLIMPEVTMEGQKRLKAAKVLCIGTGGLGAPLTMYLAAAGVGTIGLVDFRHRGCDQLAAADCASGKLGRQWPKLTARSRR